MRERFTRDAATRPPSAALLALGAALALGLAGRIAVHAGAHLPHGGDELAALGRASVALGAPWLAVAWAVGTLAGSPVRAALSGGAGLALGTFAWYALSAAAGGPAEDYATVAVAWAAVALAAGAAFGLAGAAYRRGGRALRTAALALVAGSLAGEALLLAMEWSTRAGRAALAAELAVAGAVLALGARRTAPLPALLLAALVAVGVAGLEHAVRDTLRLAGWRGL
ncbi:MAG: hypothetical protein QOH72_3498 [Solirubrobacteraceae bacterium]|jgi:hypothetical protein|nr:hypothetical protein [Solirubrobacteraceae bacterium]